MNGGPEGAVILPRTSDDTLHEYRDVTPLSWGERFRDQAWVNPASLRAIADAGGTGSSAPVDNSSCVT